MRKALDLGIKFAEYMKNLDSMKKYQLAYDQINSTLYQTHWNGDYILKSTNRPQDSGVIVGLSVGYIDSNNIFNQVSMEEAKTVDSYNRLFCSEYPINTIDTKNNISGILYGRYKGVVYAGGNHWVLLTASLTSIMYRSAGQIKMNCVPKQSILNQWKKTLNL